MAYCLVLSWHPLAVLYNSNSKMAEGKRERRVIAEDDAKIVFETSEEVSVTPTFDAMKIREDLLRGIYAYGMFW